jgi:hypothetical protein
MKLPEHLEIMTDEKGIRIYGFGPYLVYVRDNRDGQIYPITLPASPPEVVRQSEFFMAEFEKELKERGLL